MNTVTLAAWIAWGLRPSSGSHACNHFVLARQAARDLGRVVDPQEFVVAMREAGYTVCNRYGRAHYFNCRDTSAKQKYLRVKYLQVTDSLPHPLFKVPQV